MWGQTEGEQGPISQHTFTHGTSAGVQNTVNTKYIPHTPGHGLLYFRVKRTKRIFLFQRNREQKSKLHAKMPSVGASARPGSLI